MKQLLTLFLTVFVFEAAIQAQAPQLLNYQGVARNGFGNALPNRLMTLRLSIRNGSSSGAIVYQETRSVTTNAGGLYSVQIGSAGTSSVVGSMASINWQVGTKFLQVEVDPEARTNFIDLGTTQLVSVPYAMSAGVATPVGAAGGDLSGTYPNPTVANGAINTIKLADAAVTTFKLADQSVTTTKLSDYSVTNSKLADAAVTTAKIADANVTTAKLADASVTDAKIVTVAGSKVTGNISGNAANVTGTVAVANGGTGATTAAAARTNLGLGNVDNTSDLNKPISTATQAALDLKENLSNKSTSTSLGTSDALYPTQNAVKSYVDASVASATIPDATTLVKGKVQLAGDLTGTAASPAVAAGAITTSKLADGSVTIVKLADASVTDAKIVTVAGSKVTGNISGNAANVTGTVAVANGGTGATTAAAARTNLGLGNVDNTSDLNKPISTATQAALDLKENLSNKSTSTSLGTSDALYPTQNAVKSYVDASVASATIPDATTLVKGKVQLAGDLTGTAASPAVAAGAITTSKLADGSVTTVKLADASVTDAKIVTVAGSKVTGNISGNAANVTGTVAVANGGTGATTAAAARTNLGLGNVDNTSDLNKPISTATQAALDLKENLSNKSTSTSLGTSDALYPTQNAVKSYVDASVASATIPDATTLVKGKVQLAGDLTGTAASPAVAAGAITTSKLADGSVTIVKLADASVTDAKIVTVAGSKVTGNISGNAANVTGTVAVANGGTGATTAAAARTNLGLGNVDNTSDLNKPISTATQAALDLKENLSNKSTSTSLGTSDALYPTQNAVKSYVDASVASATIPDATTLVKGKVQLAGDLTGTAASPAVAAGAITTSKLADGSVTTVKLADASVTDAKIVTVAGSKVTGNISGNAANVTGTVAVANGGTGATTAAAARTNLGLGNVDNTSDLNKPISTATQAALDLKENLSNKSTSTSLGTSDALYPTQNAVKSYVDASVASATIPDATTLVKGKVQLAGDLTGTAASPAVAAGAITTSKLADGSVTIVKLADASVTDAKIVTVAGSKVTGNISGNAANVTGTVAVANGGTGATTAAAARISLGATTVGSNLFTLTNPSAVTFPRFNADNTVSALDAASFRTAIGAGTSSASGTVTSVALSAGTTGTDVNISGSPITSNGTITINIPDASATARGVVTTSSQTFTGTKTYSNDIVVNSVAIGKGGATQADNIAIGNGARSGNINTGGNANIAIGTDAQKNNTGFYNVSVGNSNLVNGSGDENTALGYTVMANNTAGMRNTGVGLFSFYQNTTGNYNTAIGHSSLSVNTTGSYNTVVGASADVASNNLTNATAIGYGATVAASNTIQLGNSSVTNVKTSGTLTAGAVTYPNTDGTNGYYLKTNGSGIASWAAVSSGATSVGAIANTSTAYGASITSGVLNLAPADGTNGGVVTTNAQTFAGAKTFSSDLTVNGITVGRGLNSITNNTAIGTSALAANTTGSYNTANGYQSLYSNTTGVTNTANGYQSLYSNTTGEDNTAIGVNAISTGSGTTNGSRNTAVGRGALQNGNSANDNTAIGAYTMNVSTTGSSNVALGNLALYATTSASYNVGVGFEALKNTTTGGNNTAIGRGAMLSNTSGDVNTAVGENALVSNTSGRYNTSIGVQAQEQNTIGGQNTAIGVAAIDRNTSGSYNAVLGAFAGRYIADNSTYNTAINNSVLVGALARPLANNSSNEIVIGYNAVGNGSNTIQLGNTSISNVKTSGTLTAGAVTYPNTDGTANQVLTTNGSGVASWAAVSIGATSVGAIAGSSTAYGASITSGVLNLAPADGTNGGVVTTSAQTFAGAKTFSSDLTVNGLTVGKGLNSRINNTAIGLSALGSNTSGTYNTATGNYALTSNTTGEGNTAIGSSALGSNTSGTYNTATGYNAMSQNSTGQLNTAYGMYSVRMNTTGNNNTGTGYDALYANTSGNNNTAAGSSALSLNTTGNYNVAYGSEAGRFIANGSTFNTTSDYSVYLGSNTKASADNAQNEIVIGYNAVGNGSNTIQLGNASITNVKTSGTITAGVVTYPNTDGTANQVLTTNGSGAASWSTPTTGVTTVGSIAGSSTVNGATISGSTITLAPANGTYGGVVTTSAQTFAGAKTFANAVTVTGTLAAGGTSFPSSTGSTGQVLTLSSSGVAAWSSPVREVADEFSASTGQTIFTLSQVPSSYSKVKMFINGVRISINAYSISSSTLTYTPSSNGGYTLTTGDRIQFDYFY